MNNKYQLLIFDWDGTLMDSIEWIVHCIQQSAKHCQHPTPSNTACRNIIGLSLEKAMQQLFPGITSTTYTEMVDCYRALFFSKTASRDHLFPGTYEMLKEFHNDGFMLAVATGKSRAGLDRALAATETACFFSATRCADEALSKPNPLMLQQLLQETNTSENQALMIGDSIHDLEMAYNAGIDSVGVSCGAHHEAQLLQHQPLTCLQQTTELMNLL